jgi:tetratricopeptide (TPR) repeat protein
MVTLGRSKPNSLKSKALLLCQLFFLTISWVVMPSLFAQAQIHSPAEILKIMEASSLSYSLGVLENPVVTPDYAQKMNGNGYYRIVNDSNLVTYSYKPGRAAREYFDEAEKSYSNKNFASAGYSYQKALGADSSYYLMYTYIGQMAEHAGKFDEAISWYQKAVKHNFIDYMAHWFMADNLMKMGNKKDALHEITIAHILNRNNPRLIESLKNIWKAAGLMYDPWYFTPQCIIAKKDTHTISVEFEANWLGYAMPKAVWKYEPGYKASMGVNENTAFSTVEERECLASLYLILKNSKVKMKKFPAFRTLETAIDKKMLDAYIFYEIILPQQPFVAYQLSEPIIGTIADYLLQVRGRD